MTGDYRAFIQSVGMPPPMTAFPAVITGRAYPQWQQRNGAGIHLPLEDPYPTCEDPADFDDCSAERPALDSDDMETDERLPCEVYPIRYMWRALDRNLSSRMCGVLTRDSGSTIWRQAFYAVNTAHATQDVALNYGPLPKGLNIVLSWGPIGTLTNNNPEWGFFFHHMNDPPGTKQCPSSGGVIGGSVRGCCYLYDQFGGQIPGAEFCATIEECAQFNNPPSVTSLWSGDGVDCPTVNCPGSDDQLIVCCTGGLLGDGLCVTRAECQEFISQGVATGLDDTNMVNCPALPCGDPVGGGGAEPGGAPGRYGDLRAVTKDHKLGACPG